MTDNHKNALDTWAKWRKQPFRLIAAPFTPMRPDGSLAMETIPAYYELLSGNRIAGAFINGSTGEGVSMSLEEKKHVTRAWAEVATDPHFALINLVGGTSLPECIELARYSAEQGIGAISVLPPFYFKPASVTQLARFITEIGKAVPALPVYYYHIPVLTGVGFSMIDLLREIEPMLPNFVGIKYTHEDFMDYLSCLHFADGRYDMLWGRDENLLAALALGAPGTVGSTYNYAAPLYYELYDAFVKNDLPEARRIQQQSIDMIRLLGKYGGISTGKAFMKLMGLDCGTFRLPVTNMSAENFERFAQDAEQTGFSRFCSTLSPAA